MENQEKTSENQVIRNEKGQIIKGTANPYGRPKGVKNFTTKVRLALERIAEGKDYTYEEAFIKQILKKAIVDGDSAIIKLIWAYLDGLPVQPIRHSGSILTELTPEERSVLDKLLLGENMMLEENQPQEQPQEEQGETLQEETPEGAETEDAPKEKEEEVSS